jgi:molybdate transport system regulatory protein
MTKRLSRSQNPKPRYRVFLGEEIALGPGKVRLLQLVGEKSSIRHAAAQMGMSYMRAWSLIRTMNRCFKAPVVVSSRGGSERGGAKLTPTGEAVLQLYSRLEQESFAATVETRGRLLALLKKDLD